MADFEVKDGKIVQSSEIKVSSLIDLGRHYIESIAAEQTRLDNLKSTLVSVKSSMTDAEKTQAKDMGLID